MNGVYSVYRHITPTMSMSLLSALRFPMVLPLVYVILEAQQRIIVVRVTVIVVQVTGNHVCQTWCRNCSPRESGRRVRSVPHSPA